MSNKAFSSVQRRTNSTSENDVLVYAPDSCFFGRLANFMMYDDCLIRRFCNLAGLFALSSLLANVWGKLDLMLVNFRRS